MHQAIHAVPYWRHRIPLPDGSVTPGSQDTQQQLPTIGLPDDLRGWSVLDLGCSDGFYSFECERRGASRVVAIDDFSSVYIDSPSGFQVARELLNSTVEFVGGDLLSLDLASLGSFDLVLFLGVMYHLRNPLLALDKIATVCARQVIVETEITRPTDGWKWAPIRRFLPERYMTFVGPEGSKDPTNWWFQSPQCVEAMLRSCGFCDVAIVHRGWNRGVFHGFAPRFSQSVPEGKRHLSVAEYGRQQYQQALERGKHWRRHEVEGKRY